LDGYSITIESNLKINDGFLDGYEEVSVPANKVEERINFIFSENVIFKEESKRMNN
jgi:hypothetical protein